MGWTFTHREKGISNRDWFQEEVCGQSVEILDMATVGGAFKGVAYAACRTKEPHPNPGEVFGIVFLTQWVPNDYYNFGYKDIEESMGPCEDLCPKRIFDLLEPLPEDRADPTVEGNWAAQWRERVAANLAKPKVTKGTRVRFPDWRWRGGPYGVCEYIGGRRGRSLFRTEAGQVVHFTGWRNGPYEVVA